MSAGEGPATRWAWAEIDLDAIKANVREVRKKVGRDRRICAVVKADAYGHGAPRVARAALAAGADVLAIATVDEGVRLREEGIGYEVPILMLSEPPISAIPVILDYRITPAVTTLDFALMLGEEADRRGEVADFHLKVNTGMNRIGILYNEAVEFLDTISFHRGLHLAGTFTHFATADENGDWDFREQLSRFTDAVNDMREAGFDPGIVHCANSASIIRYPEAYFDMVRMGIILYGLHPSQVTYGMMKLTPAMSIHARVTHVKEPPVGEGVSYGLTYRVPGNTQIATLPIGYADGLHRALSGKMDVLYHGKRMPQVGRICMDQMMFEVDSRQSMFDRVPPVQIGDEVVIIGAQGDDRITLDMMAEAIGTINYELACAFGMRLAKLYVE
ncbi:MAG: alanine racemase [Actinomycetota bacterium]|nr:alanine racemase [Actinomycetota bacterium]